MSSYFECCGSLTTHEIPKLLQTRTTGHPSRTTSWLVFLCATKELYVLGAHLLLCPNIRLR